MISNSILCYPKFNEEELNERIKELKNIGVEKIVFNGKTKIKDFNILGKGTVSVVVKAIYKGKTVALKIRRTDANRFSLEKEAKILKKVNKKGIGPKLFSFSKNFLIMEYIEGENIDKFILNNFNNEYKLKKVIYKLLIQCRILDKLRIDHGELSRASRHVIITKENEVKIIDFETASEKRKCKNLTSIISYLFLRINNFKLIKKFNINKYKLIKELKKYKENLSERKFKNILNILNLI